MCSLPIDEESSRRHTILTDSTAAMARARSDGTGAGQGFAVAVTEVCTRLLQRGRGLAVRWVPSHLGIEGNKAADERAKVAAENIGDAGDRLRAYGEDGHRGKDKVSRGLHRRPRGRAAKLQVPREKQRSCARSPATKGPRGQALSATFGSRSYWGLPLR